MSAVVAPLNDENRPQVVTPDGQKLLPGCAPRPASRTPIGTPTPERQTAGTPSGTRDSSFKFCDIFGGQDRPNSAPLEQRQLQPISPPPKDQTPPPVAPAPSSLAQSPGGGGGNRDTPPEMLTHHPQPRRLHQPLVMPLLESEASPPNSPEPGRDSANVSSAEKAVSPQQTAPAAGQSTNSGAAAGGLAGASAAKNASADNLAGRHSAEPFASTPSPDREAFNASEEPWMDSPQAPVVHRSIQNTPEPTHYYANWTGSGRLSAELPISTPSPSMLAAGAAHPGHGQVGPTTWDWVCHLASLRHKRPQHLAY